MRLPACSAWPAAALAAALLLLAGCGGGSSPASPTSPAASTPPPELVQLDSGNFDALVLAGPRPSLVEFHSPT